MDQPSLTEAAALRLAIHELAHQHVAQHHGIVALGMLHVDGRARCYFQTEPTGLASRQISAAGPLAEFLMREPNATGRAAWHAFRAGRIDFGDATDPATDAAYAAPITHRLLCTTLALVRAVWPQIRADADREASLYRLRVVHRKESAK